MKYLIKLFAFNALAYVLMYIFFNIDGVLKVGATIIVNPLLGICYVFSSLTLLPPLKEIKKLLHICSYSKPIVSMYLSFNQRNIIYECKCGKRASFKVYKPFDVPFDIETTPFITHKEYEEILNKATE